MVDIHAVEANELIMDCFISGSAENRNIRELDMTIAFHGYSKQMVHQLSPKAQHSYDPFDLSNSVSKLSVSIL
nr:hypothetical protein CFP56_16053 [Quercus suber]